MALKKMQKERDCVKDGGGGGGGDETVRKEGGRKERV
jgi:hypothetical protein